MPGTLAYAFCMSDEKRFSWIVGRRPCPSAFLTEINYLFNFFFFFFFGGFFFVFFF